MMIDEYDEQTLERVREVCQELFHGNYITEFVFSSSDKLKTASEDYSFIMAHYEAIEELLDRCGWQLCHDASAGVLYLTSQFVNAKINLTKMESYFLLALRLLYEDRRNQSASATGEVQVTAKDIIEQLTSLNAVDQVPKLVRGKSLRTLASKNIIAKVNGKWDDLNVSMVIFPSVLCAVSAEKTKAVSQFLMSSGQEGNTGEELADEETAVDDVDDVIVDDVDDVIEEQEDGEIWEDGAEQ